MDAAAQRTAHFYRTAAAFLPLAAAAAAVQANHRLQFIDWPAENSSFAFIALIYASFVTVVLLQSQEVGVATMLAAASLALAGIGLAWEGRPSPAIALFAAAAIISRRSNPIDHDLRTAMESIAGAMAVAAGSIALIIGLFADFEVHPIPFLLASLALVFGGYGLLHGQRWGHAVLAVAGMCVLVLLSAGRNDPLSVLVALSVCYCAARSCNRAHADCGAGILPAHHAPPTSTLTPPPPVATEAEWTCPPPCQAVRQGRRSQPTPAPAAQIRHGLRSFRSNTIRR